MNKHWGKSQIKLLQKYLLILFGVLIGLGLAELAARIFLPPPQVVTIVDKSKFKDRLTEERSDPLVTLGQKGKFEDSGQIYLKTPNGLRLRANTTAVIKSHEWSKRTITLKTNQFGFRGPQLDEPKIRRRILFLGDSITMSEYLPEEETFVYLVQQLSSSTPEPFETINAGINATGLANHLSLLTEVGVSSKPDDVVIAFYLNDIWSSAGIYKPSPPEFIKLSRLATYLYSRIATDKSKVQKGSYSQVPPETFEEWKAQVPKHFPWKDPVEPFSADELHKSAWEVFFDWGSSWSPSAWQHTRPLFEEFKRLSLIHGFKLHIVIFPVANQVLANGLYDYPQSQIKVIAKELDVPVLDLLPSLRRAKHAHHFVDWCHLSTEGQEYVAAEIFKFLKQ